MKVAIIAPPWLPVPPPAYGGTELVLDGLARGLVEAGHEVLLCTTGDSVCPVDRMWTYPQAIGVENARPAAELHHVIEAYDAVTTWGADIVHDHTISGLAWALQRPDLPVVTTNHGPFEGELAELYRHLGDRIPVIAISRHQASTAIGIPIAAVIHHGVDVAAHAVGAGAGGYALFLGRMSPTKGVRTAIEIARAAGMPLRIAAKMRDPEEHAYFREQVQPLLGGPVEYVGEVGGVAKQRLLADACCLLNPIAWAEPFGMVMIEALAHGTPVVATPCGAAPEIVDHGTTGFLGTTADELARALARVGDLDRQACRTAAERRFSTVVMAANHADFYRSRLDGGPFGSLVTSGEVGQ